MKFILSYDRANQAILCLQMRLMGWDVDIVHRTNDYLADANYLSRLGADLCYDPSFQHYLYLVAELCKKHPPPTDIPMQAANMPYYWGPRIPSEHCPAGTSTDTMMQEVDGQAEEHVDAIASALISSIITQGDKGNTSLCNWPLQFGPLTSGNNKGSVRALYNSEFPTLAYQSMHFTWAVYGFNSGHFPSTISKQNLPCWVILACDPYEANRALFQEFVQSCPPVLPSTASLLNHICGLGNQWPIDGYLIHSHHYQTSKPTSTVWAIQASIVAQLWMIQQLNLFVAFVHPDHDGQPISKFISQLKSSGWVLSMTKCFFPDFSNSIIGTALLIVGVHDSTQSKVVPVLFRILPSPRLIPLAAFDWQPFNKREYSVSFAKEDSSFTAESNNSISATPPSASILASLLVGLIQYISSMHGTLISPQSQAQLSSHWTAFAHRLTAHQTPTYSIPVLAFSFTQRITLTSVRYLHLSSLRVLA